MTTPDPSNSASIVIAHHVTRAPDLDHEVWRNSEPVRIDRYWSGDPAPSHRHAEVRLCWNDERLLVRFVCEQHEPLVIAENPLTNNKTRGLWDRDVCEVFLAPDANNPLRYFEFEAAPTGEWIDLAIQTTSTGRETEWDYSSGMSAMSRIDRAQVVVVITIPWSSRIPKPGDGEEWQVNLFRCVGSDEATRYLAWRPTRTPEPNFHVPAAFGILRFA